MTDDSDYDEVGSSVDESNVRKVDQKKNTNSISGLLDTNISRRTAVSAGATAAVAAVVGLAVGGAVGYLAHPSSTATTTVTAAGSITTITAGSGGVTTTITEKCSVTSVESTTGAASGNYIAVGGSTSEGFWAPIVASVPCAAGIYNVNFKLVGPTCSCCAASVAAFESAVDSKPCGIGSTSGPALINDVASAVASGVPVVFYLVCCAQCYNDPHPSNRLAYIGTSQYTASYAVSTAILPAVKALNPPADLKVPFFMQTPGRPCLEARREGFIAGLKAAYPCFTCTEVEAGPCNTNQSTSQVTAYLSSHPCTLVAFGTDGISTPGLAGAVENLKLKGKIVASGFDLLLENLNSIMCGGLYAVANQQPFIQLPTVVYELLIYKQSGGLITPWNSLTGAGVVTANNVTAFYNARATKYVEATSLSPFCTTATGTTVIT
jgi:ABC-type sugar transport system substrate-binding protein